MSIKEAENLNKTYTGLYDLEDSKSNLFFNKESGEAIFIVYNPNKIGITKIKDILVLSADELRNVIVFCKTRDVRVLEGVIRVFKTQKQYVQELSQL